MLCPRDVDEVSSAAVAAETEALLLADCPSDADIAVLHHGHVLDVIFTDLLPLPVVLGSLKPVGREQKAIEAQAELCLT